MLEDIALMRVMPNMIVVAPGDSIEAEKATLAIAAVDKPAYLRLARDATPIFSTAESPFELGVAYVLREGTDVSIVTTGTMTHEALVASRLLADQGIEAEIVHVPTIKPLDRETILASVAKTRLVVTIEEAQIAGGLGGAVAELLSSEAPTRVLRLGVDDRYGESGAPRKVLEAFGLTGPQLVGPIEEFVARAPRNRD
jgi:transketolase